jgi:Ca2+-transporting ATPase
MALGAWRLMRLGIIVKNTRTVETLGAATVICTDKTGTITENRMELARVMVTENCLVLDQDAMQTDPRAVQLIRISMFASESVPFDPMEIAIHDAYLSCHNEDERLSSNDTRIPTDGKPPMIHVFYSDKTGRIIVKRSTWLLASSNHAGSKGKILEAE